MNNEMLSEAVVSRKTFDQVMVPNYSPLDVVPVRGAGARIWDQQGREYLDFACGIAVTGLGHCHPALVAALNEQANKLWHVSNVMTNEPALRLAKRLTELTFADRVFLANSGSEANEAAFKLARKHASLHYPQDKREIISFYNGFHGRTLFAVCVGGQEKYTQGFEPLPGGISHAPFNDLSALESLISEKTCAVVMEPVQGEGGVTPATQEFAHGVRALCDKHNALLIYDEVQTGNGRSGTFFAHEQLGVTPDILTTAKGLGGGFPVAAMLTTEEIAESLGFGTHGSTYGGNALASSVALAAVNEISKPETLKNVAQRGEQIRQGIHSISERHGVFEQARGMGLLLGAPMSPAWQGKARDVMAASMRHGLWVLVAGPDVMRLAPSLLLTEAEAAEGLRCLDEACAELSAAGPNANG